jgi:hypothetical protein
MMFPALPSPSSPAGTYFTAQPLEQRAASWYMPLFLLPGSEDAVKANDWALLRLWLGKDGSSEQVDAWIERLAQPGEIWELSSSADGTSQS